MKFITSLLSALCALSTLTFASEKPDLPSTLAPQPSPMVVPSGMTAPAQADRQALVPVPIEAALPAQATAPSLLVAEQPPASFNRKQINTYVNLKSFFLELGAFFAEDNDESFEKRKLLRLLLSLNMDRLPELFSLEPGSLERYFDVKNLKAYFRLCANEAENDPKKKAAQLKSAFHFEGWSALLNCAEAQTILEIIIDLFHFKGKAEKKDAKLRELKDTLKRVAVGSDINKYVNLDELHAVIDDMLAGTVVSSERIAKTINCTATLTLAPGADLLNKYSRADKLLTLLLTFMFADDTENTSLIGSIIKLIAWDKLVEALAESYGQGIITALFDIPALQRLIRLFQDNKPLTKELMLSVINENTLNGMGISLGMLENYIDFDGLISSLEAWRSGKPVALEQVVDVPKIEGRLGVDIANAFDTTIPEDIQLYKLFDLHYHITNADWFPSLKYWTRFAGTQLALWAAGHCAFFAEGIKYRLGGMSLVALILYLTYRGNRYFSEPITGRVMLVNTLLLKFSRLASYFKKKITKVDDLVSKIPDDHPIADDFRNFFNLLTDQHLAQLDNPYHALHMLENPLLFIMQEKYKPFVESLCTIDRDRAMQRMIALTKIIGSMGVKLPHAQQWERFYPNITQQMASQLPSPFLLVIARFWPGLLVSQRTIGFLRALGPSRLALLEDTINASQALDF